MGDTVSGERTNLRGGVPEAMRSWGIALILALLLLPAASSLKIEADAPFRVGTVPWAQLRCDIVFEALEREDCQLFGLVDRATAVRLDVVGSASAIIFGYKVVNGFEHGLVPTSVCHGSCVISFPAFSGEVRIWAYVTGTENTIAQAGVGAPLDANGRPVLV